MMSVVGKNQMNDLILLLDQPRKKQGDYIWERKGSKGLSANFRDLNKTCGATFYIVASFRGIVEETRFSGTYTRFFTWPCWDSV